MPVKFLDLDAVNKPVGTFKIQGVEYEIYPLKIKGLINLSVLPEVPETQADGTAYIARALEVLTQLVPACPRDVLEDLTVDQVNAMVEFVNNLGTETVEKNSPPPRTTRKSTSRLL